MELPVVPPVADPAQTRPPREADDDISIFCRRCAEPVLRHVRRRHRLDQEPLIDPATACARCIGVVEASSWELRNSIRASIGFAIARKPGPKVRVSFKLQAVPYACHAAFVKQGWGRLTSKSETRRAKIYKQSATVVLLEDAMLESFLNFHDTRRVRQGKGAERAVRQGGSQALAVVTRVCLIFTRLGSTLNELITFCRVEYDFAIVNTYLDVALDNAFMLQDKIWRRYKYEQDHGASDAERLESLKVDIKARVLRCVGNLQAGNKFKHVVCGMADVPSGEEGDA
mmetsp:Transcript_35357/g.56843  ORF Transcript_35357/g.56843 Transcript_35357/m.56843 type:complete len:285 (-) Transcript_35357:82-936(-)